MRTHWALGALAALLLAGTARASDSGWGRHKKIYVVPAPGKVRIDGKLDDWDLSGQLFVYVYRSTSDLQSARVAMMYDAEAFYVSSVVRDNTPLMNRHDPKVDADKAWDADVCQLFFSLDPDLPYPIRMGTFQDNKGADKHLTTFYLWYYTDRKEPSLAILKGLPGGAPEEFKPLGAVPADKFEAAYVKAADGGGYAFEYRIPWTTLKPARPFKGGDLAAGAVFTFWGTPDGLKTMGGAGWAYDVLGFPGFAYQNAECWGKFIFSDKGNLPKDLVEEGLPPEEPLPLKFAYDLPEAGEVTIQIHDETGMVRRLLVAQGFRNAGQTAEQWNGLGDDGKPLAAGAYTWKGLYHQGIKTKFCFSAHNSGQPPHKTDDNTGGWGGDHGTPTAVCAAGDNLILTWNYSESGWGIIRTDLKGKKQAGFRHNAEHVASDGVRIFVAGDHGFDGEKSVKVFEAADGRPLNWGNGKPALAAPPGGDEKANVATGVAYAGGKVLVSWGARNLVAVYDAGSGDLKEQWNVPAPQRLAARLDGSALVASENKVVAVSKGGVKPFAAEKLDDPSGVALGADGTVLVANRGRLQNVSAFDQDGKYLRSIGKEGGRPRVGRYEKDGLLEPAGIAIAKDGKLWVAEALDSPKRISVWDSRTGAFAAEFFGASSYFGWAWIDPRKPDEIYCHNVLWKIDWARNACEPVSTIWRSVAPNMIGECSPAGYAGHLRVLTAKNGRQYAFGQGGDYAGRLMMRHGDLYKPLAAAINVAKGNQFIGWPPYPIFSDEKKYPNGTYLWQDANDDQIIQEGELAAFQGRSEGFFNWVDTDLNVWNDNGTRFRPVRVEDDGRPVYDFAKAETIPFKGANGNCGSLWLDPQDETLVYTLNPGRTPGLACHARDGRLLWGFGGVVTWNDALGLEMGTPGKLYGLTMPLGVAGEFTGAACYACPYYLFTKDGVYVSMVMRNGKDGKLGADITASETLTGQLVKPEGLNRYFLLAGDQDGRVTEILGLESVKRLPGGTLTISEEDARKVAAARAEYEAKKARAQKLTLVRGKESLRVAGAVGKTLDAARGFSVRAAYDEKNLYLAYEVTGSDLVNEVSDPRLIFKGGNLLDIQLAADPGADPKREQPTPGDVRLLVTRQKDKPVTVIYRPKVKGFQGEPIVLTSPTGKESFDAIEQTDAVALEYKKSGGGFTATAAIPLALLGLTPKPGATVRMDVGFIFGNVNGSQAALRSYWCNNGFSANVVNDIPNESRLVPKEWGEAVVE